MSEKQSKLNALDFLSLGAFIVGNLAVIISAFLPQDFESAQLSLVGVLILLASFYFVYKFIEKVSKEKQNIGSILIALSLSLTIYTSKNVLKLLQDAEESSISWRFFLLKGTAGKGALASDKGYIEKERDNVAKLQRLGENMLK